MLLHFIDPSVLSGWDVFAFFAKKSKIYGTSKLTLNRGKGGRMRILVLVAVLLSMSNLSLAQGINLDDYCMSFKWSKDGYNSSYYLFCGVPGKMIFSSRAHLEFHSEYPYVMWISEAEVIEEQRSVIASLALKEVGANYFSLRNDSLRLLRRANELKLEDIDDVIVVISTMRKDKTFQHVIFFNSGLEGKILDDEKKTSLKVFLSKNNYRPIVSAKNPLISLHEEIQVYAVRKDSEI